MIDVTAFGELLIDFAPAGGTEDEPQMKAMAGGAPGNFAAAAQAYGLHTALVSKVGRDAFGELLIRRFEQLGVETRGIIQDESVFTTLAFVTLDAHGERTFSFARKPGADTCITAEECDLDLITGCRLFHFGSLSLTGEPSRSATAAAVARARGAGKLISFDPNLRMPLWATPQAAREQMLWGLSQAQLVKISDDEVKFLFGCGPEEGAGLLLEQYGAKLVFVTLGAKGCYFASAGAAGYSEAPAVQPVDTTGAGDIFFGAAVSRLLRQPKELSALTAEELSAITAFACAAASLSTRRHGGIASIPPEGEVLAALEGALTRH